MTFTCTIEFGECGSQISVRMIASDGDRFRHSMITGETRRFISRHGESHDRIRSGVRHSSESFDVFAVDAASAAALVCA